MSDFPANWTIGAAAHGIGGKPSPTRTRPEACAEHGHPGVTYNPWHERTWCLCGEHTYPGRPDSIARHLACCDGPLVERVEAS